MDSDFICEAFRHSGTCSLWSRSVSLYIMNKDSAKVPLREKQSLPAAFPGETGREAPFPHWDGFRRRLAGITCTNEYSPGKNRKETGFRQEKNRGDFDGKGAFVILTRKAAEKAAGNSQSTENRPAIEKSANTTLTNVRRRSIIPVLLLTSSEYYSYGGCIL